MSVLVSRRKESKFEPIIFSEELHGMLIKLMQRSFGVKDIEQFVRVEYARGNLKTEDIAYYRLVMQNSKEVIHQTASLLTSNLRAANSIYPNSMAEYEQRRNFQNHAIVNCEQIIKELQHVVDIFNVDLNSYDRHVKALYREIDLIKRWRQRDNRLKIRLQGNV